MKTETRLRWRQGLDGDNSDTAIDPWRLRRGDKDEAETWRRQGQTTRIGNGSERDCENIFVCISKATQVKPIYGGPHSFNHSYALDVRHKVINVSGRVIQIQYY